MAVFDCCREASKQKMSNKSQLMDHDADDDENGFVFLFGCPPQLGVRVDAKICDKFFAHLEKKMESRVDCNGRSKMIIMPDDFNDIKKTIQLAETTISCSDKFAIKIGVNSLAEAQSFKKVGAAMTGLNLNVKQVGAAQQVESSPRGINQLEQGGRQPSARRNNPQVPPATTPFDIEIPTPRKT